METHDLTEILAKLPTLDLRKDPTFEEAMASASSLGNLGDLGLVVARFSGQPPWEKHAGDELVHVLDGEVEVTLLGEEAERLTLTAGSLVVIPAGTWHRSNAPDFVTVLAGTPRGGNEASTAEDPRN